MKKIAPSELILNADGSVYHLHLQAEQIATTIITVGDPDRVPMVSKHFDTLEIQVQKREFVTHTGFLNGKRLSVISTGIGTDNIDIVLNELDALVNIDLATRTIKPEHTSLDIIRIGTSGALQTSTAVDSYLATSFAVGLDGLLHFYASSPNTEEATLAKSLQALSLPIRPYVAQGSEKLLNHLAKDLPKGITATCTGFYAPQGRQLRLKPVASNLLDQLQNFQYKQQQFTNFEMETAGIYGLARLLGHHAISLNAILANRPQRTFSQHPKKTVERLIVQTLKRLCG